MTSLRSFDCDDEPEGEEPQLPIGWDNAGSYLEGKRNR